MFHGINVAGFDKPARPPALQEQTVRVRANRTNITGSLEGRRPRRPQVHMSLENHGWRLRE